MGKRFSWQWVLIALVVAVCVYYIIPPKERIKLGLDLKGGMHIVMEVDTDKIEDVAEKDKAVRRVLEIFRNRIDEFGVSEPSIQKQGLNKIVVQLPGMKDEKRALELLSTRAILEFRIVNDENLKDALDGRVPLGYEILYEYNAETRQKEPYLVKIKPDITGKYLKDAFVQFGEFGAPIIGFEFNDEGGKLFSEITGNNIEKKLAIVLDGRVKSAPVIRSRIKGKGIIEGKFSLEEARDLAIVLRTGTLPAPVNIIEKRVVGPSLGKDSIQSGLMAGIIGTILVALYMIIYYRFSGVIADTALFINIIMVMGILVMFKGTLTMPGIAGIILTIGMAVDANVIIFERIKEELRSGKTLLASLDLGYKRAFLTIFDSNITTLFTALFLFWFGTGPIKGFAVTLSIGIASSMFTAVFAAKHMTLFLIKTLNIKTLSI